MTGIRKKIKEQAYSPTFRVVWLRKGDITKSFRWEKAEIPYRLGQWEGWEIIEDPFRKGAPVGGFKFNRVIGRT